MRDSNPTVVLVPGVGMFTFAKNKKEARITGEFYINAIHVMSGAIALGGEASMAAAAGNGTLPQAKTPEVAESFTSLHNYVALPQREAFRIEYWALEEAKIQRMPKEQEFSRKILLIAGGGAGIGREVAMQLAGLGCAPDDGRQERSRGEGDRRTRRQDRRKRSRGIMRYRHHRSREHPCGTRGDDSEVRRSRWGDQYGCGVSAGRR